jgi:tRNA threonylcarbamoyladenosine biosynthesis protein TsaB
LKVLGIETSTTVCEVALAENDHVIASTRLAPGEKPTARLVPAIGELCRAAGWSARALDLVCVDIGPGSYTGLRVGLTCAKTLAFAAGAGLTTVNSLEAAAYNAPPDESLVEVAFDAARGQVFAARFARDGVAWRAVAPVMIVAADDWAHRLDPAALVLGPALVKYRAVVAPSHRVADESAWWPRATRVIELGWRQHHATPLESFWTLEPEYLRPSAAEEKRGARS